MDGEKTGAELLRAYRDSEIASFLYKSKLLEEIEKFVYDFHEFIHGAFFVFLNDNGKYIIINNYNQMEFSEEFIKQFCDKYQVTYEGVTREMHEDYEGNEYIGMLTYLFEIIK